MQDGRLDEFCTTPWERWRIGEMSPDRGEELGEPGAIPVTVPVPVPVPVLGAIPVTQFTFPTRGNAARMPTGDPRVKGAQCSAYP